MHSTTRRHILLALAALPFDGAIAASVQNAVDTADGGFAALEREFGGELGVAAIDGASGRTIGYRQDRRFPMCSTFKTVLVAAILACAEREPGLLERQVALPKQVFVNYSPVTGKHAGGALSVAELCAAALQYSDNTAANALLREVNGPAALTRYARTLGDTDFRLDRWETELNSAIPGDPRDTTTPLAMARTLRTLLLGDGLAPDAQARLRAWMLGNTTGKDRIRAAAPAGWKVADKTGTGSYGSAGDIAVLFPPQRAPVVLAIYTRRAAKDAQGRSDIIARAARIALEGLGLRPPA
ncbi:class A beta-lactamase [Massilia sp. 9096]|uniref:class A beta-lactamase n=1 Tax=Massilia sp. 9096 TaxID=1500894 RepID=UPI0005694A80|nr:class A beta-lactamase [Massilia sp. 9096]